MTLVILGGGISGLLAAYVLTNSGCEDVVLLEGSDRLGGNYAAGGLKYIRRTTRFMKLLEALRIPYNVRKPRGLILHAGQVHPYPSWLNSLGEQARGSIRHAHWVKTRGTENGFDATSMNDPGGEANDDILGCDHTRLIDALADWARRHATVKTGQTITGIERTSVFANANSRYEFDVLVPTIPLPRLSQLALWAGLPRPTLRQLTVMDFEVGFPHALDYMYTPFLQNVSRISMIGAGKATGRYQAEAPGLPDADAIMSDIEDVCRVMRWADPLPGSLRAIPGHLIPLDGPIEWPDNWYPLGRFAEWSPRATAEKVLDRASALALAR